MADLQLQRSLVRLEEVLMCSDDGDIPTRDDLLAKPVYAQWRFLDTRHPNAQPQMEGEQTQLEVETHRSNA